MLNQPNFLTPRSNRDSVVGPWPAGRPRRGRPRGLTLLESLIAVTLLGTLVMSVMTLFVMAGRHRVQGDARAHGAVVLNQELSRASLAPSRFLLPEARGAWVQEDILPPEFADVDVRFRWEDEPSGNPDLALVRVRVSWEERPVGTQTPVERKVEGATVVQRP